jgi:cobalt-zinc-cadmium resistance protein CzcA
MFQKLIRLSIENKLVVGVMTLALIIWGAYSLSQLPFDSTPDITNNQVQVITLSPSLGAQEVEQFITTPVEMSLANIPKVIERRSISRSGLSVITLVFKEEADIYWARQQVSQQLKEAEEVISKDMGSIGLAPITTGLGEIYHYTIRAAKGYEDRYTLADLRTMQDWIVRKQLSGTEGIAEVSGWGGYVKQYEVAVNPDRLNAAGVTIPEIYAALENNNENTGGSYIEQYSNQYFIRALGLVSSLEDVEQIPVKTVNGTPILIRDVAKVRFGSATRYGAVTRNGEDEVVAGITLMLKGENFQQVIRNVKERLAQVQKSLPEGVVIEPFIDRTQLVNRVTDTVAKNLLEGGLIVIFILVLFLGNFRAGMVVASVIPLSILFAFGMMRVFGVSGNLMSLGAIDFGLIVDGAVIIVESVCHHIYAGRGCRGKKSFAPTPVPVKISQKEMDAKVFDSASKIRNSAAFGEIIIMIVYIPLFTLTGIEGKMFRPMAMTVFFAILGAFILSLTYVPVASALFLSRKTEHKRNLSDRIMDRMQAWYRPAISKSLNWSRTLIACMVVLFAVSLFVFGRMGGEFIPNLDEGDFATESSMAQGTSLTQMVKTSLQAEKILTTQFPEVKQVVTRIGSAEIPTDPMPIERSDMMIALKPKKEWTSAKTKDELMRKMEEAMRVIPGLEVEITQPIQMRTNELITGIKQDVAIKIYGNDLEVLTASAQKVASLISDVKGVTSPFVEKVIGLPQIQVTYNRDKLAKYGISVKEANLVLETAFAGKNAGFVFEEDRRFSLALRMENDLRDDISSLENLYLPLPDSKAGIPLSQVAEIKYRDAPAQVTHENGQRRIYVGFNVRGRDVQSTVFDIQNILDEKLKLPAGYYYTYGGQFQNLQEAKERLMIAVPLALLLILLLLYATLKSVKESLFVFSAIPLSLIGGIWALWLRDMPFSISAGVGFIALFGVSVLNGIVLIGQFNAFEKEGITDVRERIIKGCMIRLRPVLMTALVASLGFLPMALSTSDGAEVQRPLATVVMGGLLTATVLTLFVLPSIYRIFTKTGERVNGRMYERENGRTYEGEDV